MRQRRRLQSRGDGERGARWDAAFSRWRTAMSACRPRAACLSIVLLLAGLGGIAEAQTGAASMTGLVTDQSGAAAAGVRVTATNQATNVEYTAVSNAAG